MGRTTSWALGLALGLLASSSVYAQAPTDELIRQYADPEEFFLFDYADRKEVELAEPQAIRVCAARGNAEVALEVELEESELEVAPGSCVEVVTDQLAISPAEGPEGSWELRGTLEMEER